MIRARQPAVKAHEKFLMRREEELKEREEELKEREAEFKEREAEFKEREAALIEDAQGLALSKSLYGQGLALSSLRASTLSRHELVSSFLALQPILTSGISAPPLRT